MTLPPVPVPVIPTSSHPFHVIPGGHQSPLVVHVPHASRRIPVDERDRLALLDAELAREILAMTDHSTDALAAAAMYGLQPRPHLFANNTSRLVVDPERLPAESEVMESVGMGAVYTRTHEGHPLRDDDANERDRLIECYFTPYADAFADLVDLVLTRHQTCTILDVHSYPAAPLPYEVALGHQTSSRPEICLGTDPAHTPGELLRRTRDRLVDHGFEVAVDTPFAGTYVPARHTNDPRVHSIMVEIRRDTYLDEPTGRTHAGAARVSRALRSVMAAESARALIGDYCRSTIVIDGEEPLPSVGWVISAQNPGSERLNAPPNADRHAELRARWEGTGASVRLARAGKGDWWEESLLVSGVSEAAILEDARATGQVAVFALLEGRVDIVLAADGSRAASYDVRTDRTHAGYRLEAPGST